MEKNHKTKPRDEVQQSIALSIAFSHGLFRVSISVTTLRAVDRRVSIGETLI
jgi:hypothetical protein